MSLGHLLVSEVKKVLKRGRSNSKNPQKPKLEHFYQQNKVVYQPQYKLTVHEFIPIFISNKWGRVDKSFVQKNSKLCSYSTLKEWSITPHPLECGLSTETSSPKTQYTKGGG